MYDMGVGGVGGFGFISSIFPLMFSVVALIVIGVFIYIAVSGITQFAKNEASPVLSVNAKIVTKRTNVSSHHSAGNDMHGSHSSTTYYSTFEVESGDRLELKMSGKEYGMLAEGDIGKLTFQGTRYLGFEIKRG